MDGHPRQNPAYRPATEKALETGLFLWTRFAGDSSGSPPAAGLTLRSPWNRPARSPGVAWRGCAGYEPLRAWDATTPDRAVPGRDFRVMRCRCQVVSPAS